MAPGNTPTGDSEPGTATGSLIEEVEVLRISRDRSRHLRVAVVRETPLTIYLNDRQVVTLLCTGAHAENLAVGFLHSEGLLPQRSALAKVVVDEQRRAVCVVTREDTEAAEKLAGKRTVTSGCGKGSVFYDVLDSLDSLPLQHELRIRADQVRNLIAELQRRSELYKRCRGVHNCALATTENLLIFRADIGRHNAVDMILGECFVHGVPTKDKILVTSGRITSEILIKAARVHIPMVISRSAATALALQLGRRLNMTVIGFVRGGNMTVFTGAHTVL
jgi:FdhD protein